MMINFMELRGAKLSLIPSPSLIVCREACGTLHTGRKKKVLVSTVCAYAGFHKTEDIFVIIIIGGTNYELSQQFLVVLLRKVLKGDGCKRHCASRFIASL